MARYLVTGACGGMGGAICRALTDAGNEVYGLDLRTPEKQTPWRAIAADLTDSASLLPAFSAISRDGPLDGVIHAAGIYDLNSFFEIGEDALRRIFEVNLFGVFRVNRQALPLLREGGRIVIITSELAPLDPLPFTGIYAVTKGALEKYAFSLRMEAQLRKIDVVVIRPGAVKTGMLPASTKALDRFCAETKLYPVNAARFKKIVARAESRTVPPEKIAEKVMKALSARRPRLVYNLNRNPLLLLFHRLPHRLQLRIIKRVLSP